MVLGKSIETVKDPGTRGGKERSLCHQQEV